MNHEPIARWLLSQDTGASSKAIVAHALGLTNADRAYPVDVYDFGRCYRMLKACPDVRVDVMHRAGPVWARLIAAWPELTEAYEAKLPKEDYYDFQPRIRRLVFSATP
jgi:hypothetical protein